MKEFEEHPQPIDTLVSSSHPCGVKAPIDDRTDAVARTMEDVMKLNPDVDMEALMHRVGIAAANIHSPLDAEAGARLRAVAKGSFRFQALLNQNGGLLSGAELGRRLGGLTPVQVRSLEDNGEIFKHPRRSRDSVHGYPAWQVHEGRLLPGLRSALAALSDKAPDQIELAFLIEAEEIGGESPLSLLRRGEIERAENYLAHLHGQG